MAIDMEEFGELQLVTPENDKLLIVEERKRIRKENSKKHYEKHKIELIKKSVEYNRENLKEYHKEYNKTYKDKHLYLGSFGEECFLTSLYQGVNENGKILGTGSFQRFRTPEENRLESIKSKIKNATTLNEWFPGCESHHMSEDVVIFIPKELHRSVRHNLKTGENMDLINGKALVWAGKQESSGVNN